MITGRVWTDDLEVYGLYRLDDLRTDGYYGINVVTKCNK
jgi:hypothetical protein